MKSTMSMVMKCLVSTMLLIISVQAQDVLPTSSLPLEPQVSDFPSAPLLPQIPPLSQVPPLPNCDEKCSTQCAGLTIFRRLLCYGACMAKCTILPLDHANYPCTQNCVVNTLHRKPNEKNIDGVVNTCYSKCTQGS